MTQMGFFLVLEGLDGVGKSRLARGIEAALKTERPVLRTQEPRVDCCAGRFLRQVLARERDADAWTQALAFAANRADHNARVIEPFFRDHPRGLLLCDRYYLSSLVYQARDGISSERVLVLNEEARRPDLTFFLDAPPATLTERQRGRAEARELYDSQLGYWRARYEAAISTLRARGERIVALDAALGPAELLVEALAVLRAGDALADEANSAVE